MTISEQIQEQTFRLHLNISDGDVLEMINPHQLQSFTDAQQTSTGSTVLSSATKANPKRQLGPVNMPFYKGQHCLQTLGFKKGKVATSVWWTKAPVFLACANSRRRCASRNKNKTKIHFVTLIENYWIQIKLLANIPQIK